MSKYVTERTSPEFWPGQNMMGVLLMELSRTLDSEADKNDDGDQTFEDPLGDSETDGKEDENNQTMMDVAMCNQPEIHKTTQYNNKSNKDTSTRTEPSPSSPTPVILADNETDENETPAAISDEVITDASNTRHAKKNEEQTHNANNTDALKLVSSQGQGQDQGHQKSKAEKTKKAAVSESGQANQRDYKTKQSSELKKHSQTAGYTLIARQ